LLGHSQLKKSHDLQIIPFGNKHCPKMSVSFETISNSHQFVLQNSAEGSPMAFFISMFVVNMVRSFNFSASIG
jgi:hypothetical protein